MSKENSVTNEELARMIKTGFDEVGKRLNNLELKTDRLELKTDRLEIKTDRLESGVFDIKLRLDNTAHRFEVKDLQRRVTILEKKAG